MSILNRIRYSIQRGKRQDLLNRYGFYETVETQRGILIWTNSPFGVESRDQYTNFHIHTMLDCPFLIKPHDEHETEYSCKLLLKSETYNMALEELIELLKNSYFMQDIPLLPCRDCRCMEWTGHM